MSNSNESFNKKNEKILNKGTTKKILKRSIKFKKTSWILTITLIFILILGSIVTFFTYKSENFRNLVHYFSRLNVYSDLNTPKIDNGIQITINKVIYDDVNLSIFYTIESEIPMNNIPEILDKEIKINGISMVFDSANDGNFQNGNKTYVGQLDCFVNSKAVISNELSEDKSYKEYLKINYYKDFLDIPDKFLLSLNIHQIGSIKDSNTINGHWDFNIPIISENFKGAVYKSDINVNLDNIYKNTTISKLIITPINTIVQLSSNSTNLNINFEVFDNKGRYVPAKGVISSGYIKNEEEIKTYYNYQFQNIFDDTKELTFIPYRPTINDSNKEKTNSMSPLSSTYKIPIKLKVPLNLKGETRLKTKNGEDYGTITKLEVSEEKTKLYIKSKYALKAIPVEIINENTNEVISATSDFYSLEPRPQNYIKETEEFVVEFNKALTDNNYSVTYNDHSTSMIIFEDNIFTVDIPK